MPVSVVAGAGGAGARPHRGAGGFGGRRLAVMPPARRRAESSAGQRPALPEHRRRMSIGVIAGIAHDAGILACDHEDRHKGAYFDRHLTTDPE